MLCSGTFMVVVVSISILLMFLISPEVAWALLKYVGIPSMVMFLITTGRYLS